MNALNWFEIPATDIHRATRFYSAIFALELQPFEMYPGSYMIMLPYKPGEGVGGAVVSGAGYEPSTNGTMVYLNGGVDLNDILYRVEGAGGKIVSSKYSIGENGFVASFIDSEGNKVGLHSMA